MDTAFLLSFIQVVQTGSIAEVARRQGVTPAAINQRLRSLETEMGVKLVTRSGRAVIPTEEGLRILTQAKKVMDEVRGLKAVLDGPVVFGTLVLGAFDSAMLSLVPPLLMQLLREFPGLDVDLHKGYSAALYHEVVQGTLDCAIIIRPQFELPKSFTWTMFREEPLVLMAPERLAGAEPHQLLRDQPLIGYDRRLWGGQLAQGYLRQIGLQPRVKVETGALEVIAELVRHGMGVTVVPDWSGCELPGIVKIPLPDARQSRGVGLLWNTHSPRVVIHREILRILSTGTSTKTIDRR